MKVAEEAKKKKGTAAKTLEEAKEGADLVTVKKAWKESGAPGKPTEVTIPHSTTEKTPVADTTLGGKDVKEKGTTKADMGTAGTTEAKEYEKLYHEKVKSQPAEVTIPYSITEKTAVGDTTKKEKRTRRQRRWRMR